MICLQISHLIHMCNKLIIPSRGVYMEKSILLGSVALFVQTLLKVGSGYEELLSFIAVARSTLVQGAHVAIRSLLRQRLHSRRVREFFSQLRFICCPSISILALPPTPLLPPYSSSPPTLIVEKLSSLTGPWCQKG